MLNIDNKISPLPISRYASNPSVTLHLRNSGKQQLTSQKLP